MIFLGCQNEVKTTGDLLIIGGGSRPAEVINKFIELSGGDDSNILIIPNASSDPIGVAEYQKEQLLNLGAYSVDYLVLDSNTIDDDSTLLKLDNITGLFFSGGVQSRLTDLILGTSFYNKLRKKHNGGLVISGTSAGAAIMGELMITGDELLANIDDEPFSMMRSDNIVLVEGFNFFNNTIIDQHFVERKRYNRLISSVIDNPELLGIGIGESTAIWVKPNKTFEVIGNSSVIVIDAINSMVSSGDKKTIKGHNLKLHILTNDDEYNFKCRKVIK